MALLERAVAADPIAKHPLYGLSMARMASGDTARAKRELMRAMEFHERDFVLNTHLGIAFMLEGNRQQAIAVLEKGMEMAPWFPPILAYLAANYRYAGEHAKADALFDRLKAMKGEGADVALGSYHALCSEFDLAADCFERAIEGRHVAVLHLAEFPLWKEFRETPRGRALLAKMNLPHG